MLRATILLCFLVLLWFASAVENAAENARPIPHLERSGIRYQLLVDGRPFLVLGGQAHNSSATNPQDLEPVWRSLVALHANTAEVPLYWELIEPDSGRFDFQLVDEIIAGARKYGLRLVFLWFASWKNGEMHYTPEWIKRDRAKYPRVIGPRGEEMEILSPLSEAARDADALAFTKVLQHIRSVDENERTVIMVQVENETGLLGTDRDYSEELTRRFRAAVPAELLQALAQNRANLSASLRAAWAGSNFRSAGTWTEVFGELAPEAFTAWHMARYVGAVAAAGKQAYPLPLYVNVWLINPGNERAGVWPSGGPTEHVIDIWKAAAPHLDLIAPDIYLPDYHGTCVAYSRPDNPLFVPEVAFDPHNAANAFLTFARFNGLGYSPFGIDEAVEKGKVAERAAELGDTYRLLQPLSPLIAAKQYTGQLHAIVQGEDWAQVVRLSGSLAAVVSFTKPYNPEGARGRGMIIELAVDDFVVVGANLEIRFRELAGPPRDAKFLSLEEGTFEDQRWVSARRLNGDELHVSLAEMGKILRARLLR